MSTTPPPHIARPSQTKIVATVGPACCQQGQLAELLACGVDVFRINAAHGDRQEHETRLAAVRGAALQLGWPVAVLVDLAGPKIRLDDLPDGQLMCDADDSITFVRDELLDVPGNLTTTYEPLIDELSVGDRIMLADGTVGLTVEEVGPDYARCRVVQPGLIRSRQGVNLPGVKLSVPALGPADRENAIWAAQNDIDFVGLSFVRSAEDVRQLQRLLESHSPEEPGAGPQVIAKIEKPEALEHLQEIVEVTDGVMVARGDLGVEIDIAEVAVVQKRIIAACHQGRKPVIIATQMLDSMQHSRLPTRAEVTDVANAILDGADACMLSGETAIGMYPRQAVEMMHRIAVATEPVCREHPPKSPPGLIAEAARQITEPTVLAAGQLAERLDAKLVVVASVSGETALCLSKNRHFVSTVGVSQSQRTLRRMCLYWGVIPLAGAPVGDTAALANHIAGWGTSAGLIGRGDRLVLIAGTGLAATAHNVIVVHELE